MIKYFLSENLKTKRTFAKKLVVIGPIFTFLMAVLLAFNYYVVDGYNWWYMDMLPCVMTLQCALLCSVDLKYQNKTLLCLPIDLKKLWYAKVLVVIKNVFVSNIVIFLLTNVLSQFLGIKSVIDIPFVNGFIAIIVLTITFLWQIPLWIYLNQKLNKYMCVILSIALNCIFQVLSVLKFWFLIPFCYPARLMCPILKILPNGLKAIPESTTFTPEVLNISSIPFGIIVSLILFVVLINLTAKSFSKIEAVK